MRCTWILLACLAGPLEVDELLLRQSVQTSGASDFDGVATGQVTIVGDRIARGGGGRGGAPLTPDVQNIAAPGTFHGPVK